MRESLRFVLVANDVCSSISEREYEERKKNCRFFPVVLMKRLVFRRLSWTTKWTKNGLRWTKNDEDDDSEEGTSKQTTLRAFGTHTHRQCRSWPRAKTWTTLERARYAERFTKRRLTPRAGTRFATTAWWNTAGNFGSFIIIIIINNKVRLVLMLLAPPLERRRRRRRR